MPSFNWDLLPGNSIYDPAKVAVTTYAEILENWTNVDSQFKLDDASGTIAQNSKAGATDATLQAVTPPVVPNWVSGITGGAYGFDGNHYFNCGQNGNFNWKNSFSAGCWIRTIANNVSIMGIASKQGGAPQLKGWSCLMDTSGRIVIRCRSTAVGGQDRVQISTTLSPDNPGDLRDGEWHFILMTYDSTEANEPAEIVTVDMLKIFVDGVEYSTTGGPIIVTIGTLTADFANLANSNIGAENNVNPFDGDIDNVMWFDYVLSQTQVDCLYNSGFGRQKLFVYADYPTVDTNFDFNDAANAFYTFFSYTPGPKDEGTVLFNLSSDSGLTWKYWNGSAWVPNGLNGNLAEVINANIGSFPVGNLRVRMMLKSDARGCLEQTVASVTIGYSTGLGPSVFAGVDKDVYDDEYMSPFSDATWDDPDGVETIVKAEYKIEPDLVPNWTEIQLLPPFSSLLDAVKAFSYFWDTVGVFTVSLRATDDTELTGEDSLQVTVSKHTVKYVVKASDTGEPITQINFTPGDGSGRQFIFNPNGEVYWNYEKGTFWAIFTANDYTTKEIQVDVTGNIIVNVSLSRELTVDNIPDIADAVWDELRADHLLPGSTGQTQGVIISKWVITDIGPDRVIQLFDESGTLVRQLKLLFDGVTPYARVEQT
jgi:hypothetical protein